MLSNTVKCVCIIHAHEYALSTRFIGPKDQGATKCREAVLRSLQNLDLDYIDLYLIHWPGVQKVKPTDERNSILRRESWRDLELLCKEG